MSVINDRQSSPHLESNARARAIVDAASRQRPIDRAPAKDNALTLNWEAVVPKERLAYIFGNPPFVGSKYQSDPQRAEIGALLPGIPGAGVLDYVTGWYLKAARMVRDTPIRCAFVSTNSVTQGEQPGILWPELFRLGMRIHFAHRTFRWDNEARGVAAVHCVIVGFGFGDATKKTIFEYADLKSEPHAVKAANINPYLVDAPDILLASRSRPLCDVPEIGIGNKPIDAGYYLFTTDEKAAFIREEPEAARYFRRWIGSDEFLNGYERWCLWLGEARPEDLRKLPRVQERIEAVRKVRLESKSAPTRKLGETPTRFHVENIPTSPFLVIPEVSSERRRFIPMGYMHPDTLCSNLVKIAPNASMLHFGVLSSTMHMAWVRYTAGRLKSDFRYSKDIVYNNFPWPEKPSESQIKTIEDAGSAVLESRSKFPKASLADLYDPNTMPSDLADAHKALDRAVDTAYGQRAAKSDAVRVAFLFDLYQRDTSLPLTLGKGAQPRKKSKKSAS